MDIDQPRDPVTGQFVSSDDLDDDGAESGNGRLQATAGDTAIARDEGLRWALARTLGENIGGDRDYYDIFDWDKTPDVESYYAMALRNPFGFAVTFLPPMTSWRDPPKVVDQADTDDETSFERELSTLVDDLKLWNYAKRADKLAGIGRYGALILQFDDIGGVDEWSEPVQNPGALVGLRPVSRKSITEITLGGPDGDRWGKPTEYQIDISDENDDVTVAGPDTLHVHHTRVIHIPSDELLDDEVRGIPRQAPVYNNLVDIEKTMGSAGELAYRATAWGININIDPEFKLDDPSKVQEHAQRWYYGLEPILRTEGAADVQSLGGEEIDPSPIVQANVQAISAARGMPQSVLLGNETGERATTQDLKEWYGKIQERREEFVEPLIVRALIDRLQEHGILPETRGDGYDVEWTPLAELSESDQAEVHETRSRVVQNLPELEIAMTPAQQAEYVEEGMLPDGLDDAIEEAAAAQEDMGALDEGDEAPVPPDAGEGEGEGGPPPADVGADD